MARRPVWDLMGHGVALKSGMRTPYLEAPWRVLPRPLAQLELVWHKHPIHRKLSLTLMSFWVGWNCRHMESPAFSSDLWEKFHPNDKVFAFPHPAMLVLYTALPSFGAVFVAQRLFLHFLLLRLTSVWKAIAFYSVVGGLTNMVFNVQNEEDPQAPPLTRAATALIADVWLSTAYVVGGTRAAMIAGYWLMLPGSMQRVYDRTELPPEIVLEKQTQQEIDQEWEDWEEGSGRIGKMGHEPMVPEPPGEPLIERLSEPTQPSWTEGIGLPKFTWKIRL